MCARLCGTGCHRLRWGCEFKVVAAVRDKQRVDSTGETRRTVLGGKRERIARGVAVQI